MFKEKDRIQYSELNARQKETFNFQKFSAAFADYGYATIKLNDDWNGTDFIAQHIDGEKYLKVQLKARLTFDKKYCEKDIFVCFREENSYYLYHHDELLNVFLSKYHATMAQSSSWKKDEKYTFRKISKETRVLLQDYLLE